MGVWVQYYPRPPCSKIMSRARSWTWTLNNFTDEEEGAIQELECFKYLIYGKEIGENGTPHLQGFIQFATMKSLEQVKIILGPRVHLERSKGTPMSNRVYCSKGLQSKEEWELLKEQGPNYGKEADVTELGKIPTDGSEGGAAEKERWKRARELAAAGKFDEIDDDIYIRHFGNLKKIHQEKQVRPADLDQLDYWWFYGPTGTGKSRTARAENPDYYVKDLNKWWDGYAGEACVIIDEWAPAQEEYLSNYLKKWADHYAFSAEVKGGTKCIRPKKIIITSNWCLEDCFKLFQNVEPLLRRFTQRKFDAVA